ncbi:MAG: acyl-CoA dehydrogenase family protein [Halioglobus sp.]|nr:acyl-CoA dehydrogenase family protein [Halioglobus sp.]
MWQSPSTTASARRGRAGAWPWPPPVSNAGSCCARRRVFRRPRAGWWSCTPPIATRRDRDPAVQDAVIGAYLDAESYCLATYRTACRLDQGGKIGAESSTNKIFWSELDQRMHATAMSILGRPGGTAASRARRHRCRQLARRLAVRPVAARSTPGPTRYSAISSPSGCWGCRADDQKCPERPFSGFHV